MRLLILLRDLLVVHVHLHATYAVIAAELRRGLLLLSLLLVAHSILIKQDVPLVFVELRALASYHLLLTHVLELFAKTLLVLHDLRLHVVQVLVVLEIVLNWRHL